MRRAAWLALLPPLALTLAGCANSPAGVQDPGPQAQPHPLAFRTLEGCDAMDVQPVYKVLRDEASWEQFWAENCATTGADSKPPAVAFATRNVVAALWGRKSSGGYTIEVQSITQSAQEALIVVVRTSPGANCASIAQLTFPAHIVDAERIQGEGRFPFSDRTMDC